MDMFEFLRGITGANKDVKGPECTFHDRAAELSKYINDIADEYKVYGVYLESCKRKDNGRIQCFIKNLKEKE